MGVTGTTVDGHKHGQPSTSFSVGITGRRGVLCSPYHPDMARYPSRLVYSKAGTALCRLAPQVRTSHRQARRLLLAYSLMAFT